MDLAFSIRKTHTQFKNFISIISVLDIYYVRVFGNINKLYDLTRVQTARCLTLNKNSAITPLFIDTMFIILLLILRYIAI